MASVKELQTQIETLQAQLQAAGLLPRIRVAVDRPEDRPDYIPFGSDKHMTFLGLVQVTDPAKAKEIGYTVYTSPTTGDHYRLQDEIAPVNLYRGVDPDKAILLVLRQKVGQFEAGAPRIPEDAPPTFIDPRDGIHLVTG